MPKGYWIANVDVAAPDAYGAYIKANAAAFAAYNARFLVRGGPREVPEGAAKSRTVVIEFPSYAKALECYNSDLYTAAKAIRDPISNGDLIIIEGYDGPQPLSAC